MTKQIDTVEVLEAKKSTPFTLEILKSIIFDEMTPLEMLIVLNKMCEDLLCSSVTDEDAMYRNEIVVFQRNITKMILSIQKNRNPNINIKNYFPPHNSFALLLPILLLPQFLP